MAGSRGVMAETEWRLARGWSPAELLETGREEVARYGVTVRRGRVATAARTSDGFTLGLQDGGRVAARRLVVQFGGGGGCTHEEPACPVGHEIGSGGEDRTAQQQKQQSDCRHAHDAAGFTG